MSGDLDVGYSAPEGVTTITEFKPEVAGAAPGSISLSADALRAIMSENRTTSESYLLALALKGNIWSPRSWLETQKHRKERRRKATMAKASRKANR